MRKKRLTVDWTNFGWAVRQEESYCDDQTALVEELIHDAQGPYYFCWRCGSSMCVHIGAVELVDQEE